MKKILLPVLFLFCNLFTFGQVIEDEVKFNYIDNSDNEEGFILISVEEDGSYTELESVDADIESIIISRTQVQGKRIAVLAFNRFGRSGITNILEFGFPPSNPSGVVFEITFKQSYNVQIP